MAFGETCTKCGKLVISCVCALVAVSIISAELLWKINPHEEEHKHAPHREEGRVAVTYTPIEGTGTSSSSGTADDLSWMPLDGSPPRRSQQESMPWLYGTHITSPIWFPDDDQISSAVLS